MSVRVQLLGTLSVLGVLAGSQMRNRNVTLTEGILIWVFRVPSDGSLCRKITPFSFSLSLFLSLELLKRKEERKGKREGEGSSKEGGRRDAIY